MGKSRKARTQKRRVKTRTKRSDDDYADGGVKFFSGCSWGMAWHIPDISDHGKYVPLYHRCKFKGLKKAIFTLQNTFPTSLDLACWLYSAKLLKIAKSSSRLFSVSVMNHIVSVSESRRLECVYIFFLPFHSATYLAPNLSIPPKYIFISRTSALLVSSTSSSQAVRELLINLSIEE
jgi:hypothetical protein